MGRKAFGPTKKKACDTRRDCKKKKQSVGEAKAQGGVPPHERMF